MRPVEPVNTPEIHPETTEGIETNFRRRSSNPCVSASVPALLRGKDASKGAANYS
jgi:hypothetical protein